MSKWKCRICGEPTPCVLNLVNDEDDNKPIHCPVDDGIKPEWVEVLEDEIATDCHQLPKLTAEVFDRPDCPKWAEWAAVSDNGTGAYFENEPEYDGYLGCWLRTDKRADIIKGDFDSIDWQNSLIKRPAQLPDWCKIGKWVYSKDEKGYALVKSLCTIGVNLLFADGHTLLQRSTSYIRNECVQARLRPFNADEMRGLVGKVIEWKGDAFVVTAFSSERKLVVFDSIHHTADELIDSGYTIDGKPCGVFEHLENGEWVE